MTETREEQSSRGFACLHLEIVLLAGRRRPPYNPATRAGAISSLGGALYSHRRVAGSSRASPTIAGMCITDFARIWGLAGKSFALAQLPSKGAPRDAHRSHRTTRLCRI